VFDSTDRFVGDGLTGIHLLCIGHLSRTIFTLLNISVIAAPLTLILQLDGNTISFSPLLLGLCAPAPLYKYEERNSERRHKTDTCFYILWSTALKPDYMSQNSRPLLHNVYNKNSYFSGNGVKTSSVSAETNTLTTAASERVKLKDSTRCLLDRSADGYKRQIQTEADQRDGARHQDLLIDRPSVAM
jgi:hypothetical protein